MSPLGQDNVKFAQLPELQFPEYVTGPLTPVIEFEPWFELPLSSLPLCSVWPAQPVVTRIQVAAISRDRLMSRLRRGFV
jgi:hypothetical protein